MIGIVMPGIRRILIFIARLSQVLRRRYLSGLHVWVFHMSDKNRCTWCFGSTDSNLFECFVTPVLVHFVWAAHRNGNSLLTENTGTPHTHSLQ